jgi:hypothetical protein
MTLRHTVCSVRGCSRCFPIRAYHSELFQGGARCSFVASSDLCIVPAPMWPRSCVRLVLTEGGVCVTSGVPQSTCGPALVNVGCACRCRAAHLTGAALSCLSPGVSAAPSSLLLVGCAAQSRCWCSSVPAVPQWFHMYHAAHLARVQLCVCGSVGVFSCAWTPHAKPQYSDSSGYRRGAKHASGCDAGWVRH